MVMSTKVSVVKRLRSCGLRATVHRISVFQAVSAGPAVGVTAEGIYKSMLERGMPIGIGAVYRATKALEHAGLLTRTWDRSRKSIFRVAGAVLEEPVIWIRCPESGNVVSLEDPALSEVLVGAARARGVELLGRNLELTAL